MLDLLPFPVSFCFMNLWSLEFTVLFLCRCQCIITHLVSTLPQQLSSTDPLPQFSTTHSGVNRSPRLPSKQVCTYVHLLLTSSAARSALAGATCWLCSNWTAEEKAGCCSARKSSENYKLKNLFAWTSQAMEEQRCILHPCSVLHSVLLCPQCPYSKWLDTGRAERELVWAVTRHVQANHCGCPPSWKPLECLYHPVWWTGLQWCRRGQLCCPWSQGAAGKAVCPSGAAPSVPCGWKGGRYTVREWVAGLTVNRSLFLLCHTTPDDSRVRGDGGTAGLVCVCWERAGIAVVEEPSHFKGINNSGVWGILFIYFLSVSFSPTFPHRMSQTVTPGVGGRGGGVGFVFPDVPGITKHSSLDLSLPEIL